MTCSSPGLPFRNGDYVSCFPVTGNFTRTYHIEQEADLQLQLLVPLGVTGGSHLVPYTCALSGLLDDLDQVFSLSGLS